jgi:hemerythrin-like domain-containing protein
MEIMAGSKPVLAAGPAFSVEIAVQHICGQHRNLARVFRAQKFHVEAIASGRCVPDFGAIAAMLHYVDLFSYNVHNPTEEKFLFDAMRRNGAPRQVVDKAAGAHAAGARAFAMLRSSFDAWHDQPRADDARFPELLAGYVAAEAEHMSYEERVLLPCALETLPADDWDMIAPAFQECNDPLFGPHLTPELEPLHQLLAAQGAR